MDTVDEIKQRLPIDELVGRYVELRRSGASYKGLCPFHSEKTPSFYVNPSRGTYKCFGCDKGGDVLSFVMEMEKLPFLEALERLAEQTGVPLPDRDTQAPSLKKQLYAVNEAAAMFFSEALRDARGQAARQYVQERKFGKEAIELFDLGYAPRAGDALQAHLEKGAYEQRIMIAAGLILQDDETGRMRDRFRGRLMFPIRDGAGKILGFGGRVMGDGQPKYLNSPQTEVFDKSGVLFGLHLAASTLRSGAPAVLVEGYLDTVRAHLSGFANVVASLGTAVTPAQLSLLRRYTQTVILALDPDSAGQSAAARVSLEALRTVMQMSGRSGGAQPPLQLRIAQLPSGRGDPDDLIRDDPDLWKTSVRDAVPALEYYVAQSIHDSDRSRDDWRTQVIDRVLPVIQQFGGSAVLQPRLIGQLVSETGVDIYFLEQAMRSGAPNVRSRPGGGSRRTGGANSARDDVQGVVTGTTARVLAMDARKHIEERLLSILLQVLVIPDDALQLLKHTALIDAGHQSILDKIIKWAETASYDSELFNKGLLFDQAQLAQRLRDLQEPLPRDGQISVAVAYHLARLERLRVEEALKQSTHVLADVAAEDQSDIMNYISLLLQERQDVEIRIDHLSQLTVQGRTLDHGTMDQDPGSE